MSREIAVQQIESDGGIVRNSVRRSDGFVVPVSYVDADGVRYSGEVTRRLLRDAKAFAAKLPMEPEDETYVLLDDETGRFIGTKVRFHIGGGDRR